MCRILAGTLAEVGMGKFVPDDTGGPGFGTGDAEARTAPPVVTLLEVAYPFPGLKSAEVWGDIGLLKFSSKLPNNIALNLARPFARSRTSFQSPAMSQASRSTSDYQECIALFVKRWGKLVRHVGEEQSSLRSLQNFPLATQRGLAGRQCDADGPRSRSRSRERNLWRRVVLPYR